MENMLYFLLSNGEFMNLFRPDQNYESPLDLGVAALGQHFPEGVTILNYAVAVSADVKAHMATYDLSRDLKDNFGLAEKGSVPAGKMIFPPYGVAIEDIPSNQVVLYGNVPE